VRNLRTILVTQGLHHVYTVSSKLLEFLNIYICNLQEFSFTFYSGTGDQNFVFWDNLLQYRDLKFVTYEHLGAALNQPVFYH
jgi:hypothetical protein